MARLRLNINGIIVATSQETAEVTFGSTSYLASLQDFKLKKKMYQPTEVIATLQFHPKSGNSWTAPDKKDVMTTFLHKNAVVDVVDETSTTWSTETAKDTIGSDYYVHEVIPTYTSGSLSVELRIYSPDKLLTLNNCCNSWTAKKLANDILKDELPKYKLPYNANYLGCDDDQMKHILNKGQEHIFPYLVQYNESFYDMLARTCNRWGEFLYWEGGQLRIGYNADEKKVKTVSNSGSSNDNIRYYSITFHNNTSTPSDLPNGPYSSEATYDNNVLNSTVKKDGAALVFGTIKNMADMKKGADYYWLRKVGQVLTNNKSVMNFLFDTAVNDLLVLAQQEAIVSQYNDKHNKDYFNKPKAGISTQDEQYDDVKSKKTLNQFSEYTPILNAEVYAKVLACEMLAEQNTVDIDFDTSWPGLKLGSIIKIGSEDFIVVELSSQNKKWVEIQVNATTKQKEEVSYISQVFHATAIGKTQDMFYPMMIPAGHIRTCGPQVAVVVDVDDPNKKNRVRLKYPWQLTSFDTITASDLKDHDVSDATPWLLYAASSGPAGAGVHGRHYLAEKVLVNYANNNVERPFVVGAVSTNTPRPLKTSSAVIQAPNGEYIKVHEGSDKGATAFMASFTPGLSLVNGFLDIPDIFGANNEISKAFEGGVELGDKYGIWKISGSTDRRAIDINSPWGNVSINAFTGITVNAPNGNINIRGKNVTIEAGNNLTLRSGTNIRNKFASSYGNGACFNFINFINDATTMAAKKLASLVESVIDLALIRSLIEVYWRPQEGALTIQSNRYLKLGAGGALPGYPKQAYLNPMTLEERAKKLTHKETPQTLKMGPAMVEFLKLVPVIVDKMIVNYKECYRNCVFQKKSLDNAIDKLRKYSNTPGSGSVICNTYDKLKDKFWDPEPMKFDEVDMGFKNCNVDSIKDVDINAINSVRGFDKAINKYDKFTVNANKEYILRKRKKLRAEVVKKANELLNRIAKLRTEPHKLTDLTMYGIGPRKKYAPADYIKALQTAISAEKCKESEMFNYTDNKGVLTDARTKLTYTYGEILRGYDFHRDALIRRISLNLVEGWGMESKAINFKLNGDEIVSCDETKSPDKPKTDDELVKDAMWNLYVRSLEFTKPLAKSASMLDDVAAVFDPSKFNLATPIKEYYSWGNAKAGQILFGTGLTYSMNADGTISKLETHLNQGMITKALHNGEEQSAYDRLNESIQSKLFSDSGFSVAAPPAESSVDGSGAGGEGSGAGEDGSGEGSGAGGDGSGAGGEVVELVHEDAGGDVGGGNNVTFIEEAY